MSASKRKRYLQVGVGGRAWCYTAAIAKEWKENSHLVAICDTNQGRMEYCNERITKELEEEAVAMYPAESFEDAVRELKPDVVVVTSVDSTHDDYIVRAMELGCDVICEKPMTIDEEKTQRIVDAVKRTGRDLRVTFNCRYMPHMLQVKELLMSGVIGRLISLDVHWVLDVDHGASYFRRWHGEMDKSGGLLLHKATHHLDLVNWFISSDPVEVTAMGDRKFYGAQSGMAERYGLQGHGERCSNCPVAEKCPFYMDIDAEERVRRLYKDNEKYDGYMRDRCVFHESIDIYDTMSLLTRFDNGVILTYSLNAFAPYEGFRYCFNGDKGRLEFEQLGTPRKSDGTKVGAEGLPLGKSIRVYPHFEDAYSIPVETAEGSHGGGDTRLMSDLFGDTAKDDPFVRAADYSSGAMSLLIGAAANKSIKTGEPVKINEIVKGLTPARYPVMQDGW